MIIRKKIKTMNLNVMTILSFYVRELKQWFSSMRLPSMAPLWCLTYGTASQCSSLTSQVIDRINQSLWCRKLKAYWSRRRCGLVWILLCRASPDPYSHCLVANPSIHLLHHSSKLYFFLPPFPIYMYQLSSNNWHFSSIKKSLNNLNGPARGFWLVET